MVVIKSKILHQTSSRVLSKIAPPKTASATGFGSVPFTPLTNHNSKVTTQLSTLVLNTTKHLTTTNRNICRLPCLLLERPAKGAYLKPILRDTRLRRDAAL